MFEDFLTRQTPDFEQEEEFKITFNNTGNDLSELCSVLLVVVQKCIVVQDRNYGPTCGDISDKEIDDESETIKKSQQNQSQSHNLRLPRTYLSHFFNLMLNSTHHVNKYDCDLFLKQPGCVTKIDQTTNGRVSDLEIYVCH